ncbi:MAG: LLM class flavin-dependent oxidoreductase [Dehalococcoidia bacterium]|nr:LLM class flavin-dependent oxidoreductase [Dehalococcoidia bacterium]
MPFGFVVNYQPPDRQMTWAQDAESAGFSEIWVEGDIVHCTAVALATQAIPVGSGVLQVFNHEPSTVAATAATLAGMTGGRFRLGIGASTRPPSMMLRPTERAHSAPRLAEFIALMRRYWAGEGGRFTGRFFDLEVAGAPAPHPIPIYVGALRMGNIRMAGRVADGVAGHPFWPARYARDVVLPTVRAGAERAGRAAPPISGWIFTAISDDPAECRHDVKQYLILRALRFNAMDEIAAFMGITEPFAAAKAALLAGDTEAALEAIPDGFIEEMAIVGAPDDARRQFRERWAGVYDVPVLHSPGGPRNEQYLAAIIDTFGR